MIIEYPPREPIERPRPGDRPTGYLPPQWERVIIRGWTETGPAGERIQVPDHEQSVYAKADGSIYVPRYALEVSISGILERTPEGQVQYSKPRKERKSFGGYWACGEPPVRGCKADNPPPVELREREPRVIEPPPARIPGQPSPRY
ncbi:hypothetical protein HYW30_00015 [Candidatus Azambacteria bacterium]|nr:hypothetical protein [Candidatus Azambacteria bacterium]